MDGASFRSRASARHLFTSIVDKLSATVEPSSAPALSASRDPITPSSRHLFVTAHCLLPSIFLPALDILDQGLVLRCVGGEGEQPTVPTANVYYVRSSHPSSHHHHPQNPNTRHAHHLSSASRLLYEVRTSSWNCTCVAFTLSAYHNVYHPPRQRVGENDDATGKGEGEEDEKEKDKKGEGTAREKYGWEWGGLSKGEADEKGPPVCKHLLACVLAERGGKVFGDLVVKRKVTEGEAAELALLWD